MNILSSVSLRKCFGEHIRTHVASSAASLSAKCTILTIAVRV
jgi:hypothetical protein